MRELLIVLIAISCMGCVGESAEKKGEGTETQLCNIGITAVSDIGSSPEAYLDKNVTLEGLIREPTQSVRIVSDMDYLLEDCNGDTIYLAECRGADGEIINIKPDSRYRVIGTLKSIDRCMCEINVYGMWKPLKPDFPIAVADCETSSERRCIPDPTLPVYYFECRQPVGPAP